MFLQELILRASEWRDYPQKLVEIPDSPYALYYIGKLPDESKKAVAIVGARMRSAYGCEVAKKLRRSWHGMVYRS